MLDLKMLSILFFFIFLFYFLCNLGRLATITGTLNKESVLKVRELITQNWPLYIFLWIVITDAVILYVSSFLILSQLSWIQLHIFWYVFTCTTFIVSHFFSVLSSEHEGQHTCVYVISSSSDM